MNPASFILHGDFCDSQDPQRLRTQKDGYLVCENGLCAGAFPRLPEHYAGMPIIDCSGKLILPGLVDLHVHAPQYTYRALGLDLELLDWLKVHTFPEEARYASLDYARRAYPLFVHALRDSPTTRAVIFATIHREATSLLMDLLEESGLIAYVGKVNMDRNCPDNLRETVQDALPDTRRWLSERTGRSRRIFPILTPRFLPACSDPLLEGLGALCAETGLPVQSHLSENQGEVELVRRLCPWASCYADAYDHFGLFGSRSKTIMAHCVLSGREEISLIRKRGVFVAHCPQSNVNLSSGIAPVRKFLDEGCRIGLGTDVAGGGSLSLLRAMSDAVGCSKLRWRLVDQTLRPLSIPEAFFLGTAGGGAFFGKVGRFQPGYEFDAVVLDDAGLAAARPFSVEERVERAICLSEEISVVKKFVNGRALF